MSVTINKVTSRVEWLVQRKGAVTASEIGALFSCHPYKTALGLYNDKANIIFSDIPDNAAMRRGRLLESAAAEATREQRPEWTIEKANEYYQNADKGIGATPDFYITCPKRGRGVLQTKVVLPSIFEEQWTLENPPLWIMLQVQTEMLLAGVTWGAITAFVVDTWRWPCHVYELDAHVPTQTVLTQRVQKFWADLKIGRAPIPDYARDLELFKTLHPKDNGEMLDLTRDNRLPELIAQRESLKEKIKAQKPDLVALEAIETEIKAKIGDALGAHFAGGKVLYPTIARKGYSVAESTYRKLSVMLER